MSEIMDQVKLQNGTLIRHKVTGYEGRIDGTTEIKGCFTVGGALLDKINTKQTYQYRVMVKGEVMRRIAPAEDLDILERVTEIICPHCHFSFQTKPGLLNKPGGCCQCGRWICPSCLDCRDTSEQSRCLMQRKRFARKPAIQKKNKEG